MIREGSKMNRKRLRSVFVTSAFGVAVAAMTVPVAAQSTSPNGVRTLSPAGAIKPTGTWDVAARARDFIYIAGMRGIDPEMMSMAFQMSYGQKETIIIRKENTD
jgi:hypothetical protein